MSEMATEVCTCGSGVWGTCDECGTEAWVNHRCSFPCDDVTCENVCLCIGCLTGRPCPMHNGAEWDDESDERDSLWDHCTGCRAWAGEPCNCADGKR